MAQLPQPGDIVVRGEIFARDTGYRKLPLGIEAPAPRLRLAIGFEIDIYTVIIFQPGNFISRSEGCYDTVILLGPPRGQKRPRPVERRCMGRGCIVTATERERKVVFRVEEIGARGQIFIFLAISLGIASR